MESPVNFKWWNKSKESYAQCGEDLILDFLFTNSLKIANPSYLDIGAHDPVYLSNTNLFYRKGCAGVCVEPDPILFKKIKDHRKRDICINAGIGIGEERVADFYVMTTKTLNTFSKDEAERYQSYGSNKIEEIIQIKLLPVMQLIDSNFAKCPNIVSLDVEGLDFQILKDFDFSICRPQAFCVETLTYTEDNSETKIREIIQFMENNGYFVYADTFINTIFVDQAAWKNR